MLRRIRHPAIASIEEQNLKSQSYESFNLEQLKHQHEDKATSIERLQRERDAAISCFSKYRDQLCALDKAVSLINKLITPSSLTRQTRVQLPMPPSSSQLPPYLLNEHLDQGRSASETRQDSYVEIRDEFEDDNALIQNELDHLNSRWKLEETNIPCLLETINVMQSRTNLLSNENEAMSSEIKSLRQSLSEAEKVNVELMKVSKIMTVKLRHVLEKLYKENKKVNLKLRKAKEYLSCIKLKETYEKEKSIAIMLKIHEEMMRTKVIERNLNLDCEEIPCLLKCETDAVCSNVIKNGIAAVKFSSKEESRLRNNSEGGIDEIIEINKMISIENQKENIEVKEIGKENQNHTDEHILFFPSGTKKVGLRFQSVPISNNMETEKEFQSTKKSGDLVLVCGIKGFDKSINVVPSIGARLVAIDGVALTASNPMSLGDIKRKVSSKISARESFSLVFRNIELSDIQRKLLMKGVQSMNMESSKNTLVSSSKVNKKIRIQTGYHV